jgi:hypothetical protein
MVKEHTIEVDKSAYLPRSVLIAPPLIFQTRVTPSSTCPYSYSSTFIQQQHTKVTEDLCAAPYHCSDQVMQQAHTSLACAGAAQSKGTTFGINSSSFDGRVGFADFLFSLTDNPFLFREKQVLSTRTFLNGATETCRIILLFFTPQAGMTSVLTITADFLGEAAAKVKVKLDHYEILEGEALDNYLAFQILVLVNIVIMVLDVAQVVRGKVRSAKEADESIFEAVKSCFKYLIDLITSVCVLVFVVIRVPTKVSSAPDSQRLIGSFSGIEWGSHAITLEQKTSSFFDSLSQFLKLIETEKTLDSFCSVILFISLLRVIQCTSMHPRLALLTGTIAKAADNLLHALYLIIMLLTTFAAIANWRFGTYREDFSTFGNCLLMNFMMMFGEVCVCVCLRV